MFARWGRFVYRFRWATLVASALLLGLSIAALLTGAPLTGNGGFGAGLPAGRAADLINKEISSQAPSGSTMTLLFSSRTMNVTDPAYRSAVESALSPLTSDSRVTAVHTPYNVPAIQQAGMISKDGRKALAVVDLKDDSPAAQLYFGQIVAEVHPGPLSFIATGQVPIN